MQNAGYAALQIIPSFEGFQGRLERGTAGSLIAAGTTGGRQYGEAAGRSMASRFSTYARRAALAGVAGFAIAGAAAIKFGKDSVQGYEDHLRVVRLTKSTIETTGHAANVTTQEVSKLSDAIERKTGVDGDAVQSGANMLLTFKNIRNEAGAGNDIFNQSLSILTDMATFMKTDASTSAIQLGKALNDPAKGVTALSRVGVTFTEQQKDQIKNFEEQGRVAEAQKIILRELTSEFGGAARAQMDIGDRVTVAYHQIQDEVGRALLPTVRDFQRFLIREGVPAAKEFATWFRKEGVPAIRGFVDEAKPLAHELLPAAANVLGTVRDTAKDALPYIEGIVKGFNDLPDWAKKGITVGGIGAIAAGKLGLFSRGGGAAGGGGGLLGGITKAAPLPVYVVNNGIDLPGSGGTGGRPGGGAGGGGGIRGVPGMVGGGLLATGLTALGFGLVNRQYENPDKYTHPGLDTSHIGSAQDFTEYVKAQRDYETWFKNMTTTNDKLEASTRRLIAGTGQYATEIKGLPKELVTKFVAPGLVDNRRDAIQLAKQYDLTPKQKETLFKTLGIPEAKKQTNDVLDLYRQANRTYVGEVRVDTGDTEARLNRILALQAAISKQHALQASGALPTPGGGSSGGSSSPRSKTSSRGRSRSGTPINIHVGGERVASIIDDRIGTYDELAGERRRAGAPQ